MLDVIKRYVQVQQTLRTLAHVVNPGQVARLVSLLEQVSERLTDQMNGRPGASDDRVFALAEQVLGAHELATQLADLARANPGPFATARDLLARETERLEEQLEAALA